jgi:hypothetical protein
MLELTARRRRFAPALGVFLPLVGCGGGGDVTDGGAAANPSPAQPQSTPPTSTSRPIFVDATATSNINFETGYKPRNFDAMTAQERERAGVIGHSTTGGAAAGDYDNDGDIDLFITRGDVGPNLLYRNEGNLVFVEVAASAGVAFTKSANENYAHSGPTFADIDGDGDLDLLMGGLWGDPSLVFSNNGDGTFTDVTAGSGIDTLDATYTISATFGDYDLDGDLDLFVSHWGTRRDYTDPGDTQHLWRNDSSNGVIRFTSVSVHAGISPTIINLPDTRSPTTSVDYTFTPTFARLDGDLYPDILSVSDFGRSMIFTNRRDGTFYNSTNVAIIVDDYGMGSAVADYDADGDLDWFVTSIYDSSLRLPQGAFGNRLYRNDSSAGGGVVFIDATQVARVADGGWGWAACFLDFENDGNLDIYHTNGWYEESSWGDFLSDSSRAFVANGNGRFAERSGVLGLEDSDQGRAVVCADFDNDGDTDILLLHQRSGVSATLWRNDTTGNSYLRIKLRGKAPNTAATGARIYATIGSEQQMREIMIGSNFASQNPTVQIFGLGTAGAVDELRIEWSDGTIQTFLGVAANQSLEYYQP